MQDETNEKDEKEQGEEVADSKPASRDDALDSFWSVTRPDPGPLLPLFEPPEPTPEAEEGDETEPTFSWTMEAESGHGNAVAEPDPLVEVRSGTPVSEHVVEQESPRSLWWEQPEPSLDDILPEAEVPPAEVPPILETVTMRVIDEIDEETPAEVTPEPSPEPLYVAPTSIVLDPIVEPPLLSPAPSVEVALAQEPELPLTVEPEMTSVPREQPVVRRVVRPGPRRIKGTIRKIDPWSVLKLSLLFYVSLMILGTLVVMLIFSIASGLGIVGNLEAFIRGVGWPAFRLRSVTILRLSFVVGLVQVIFWSAVNLIITFIYNLVSEVVGGIEVTVTEREI